MDTQPSYSSSQPHDRLSPSHDEPKRHHVWVWVIVFLIFALVAYLVLRHHDNSAGSAQSSRRGQMGPVTINAVTAQKGDIGVYLSAIGTVTPVYTSAITSQVSGLISAVHYREGQIVKKGDPLIDIDPRIYEAQLTQAQGTLERDTNVLGQAQMDLERYQTAWSKNAIAKQQLEDQQKLVLQDQGTVKNDQGTVDYDQVQVGWCHITAPFTGRVGLRLVDPGNVVQANGTNPLVVITEIQPVTVIFTIAEDDLVQVQAQTRQRKKLDVQAFDRAQQTKIATGKLLTYDNQIDTTTGTVKMRAIFDNKDDALFPNQFVNTKLLVKTLEGVTLIPTSTIQHNGQTAFVYLLQNDTAQIRNIKPGVTDGGNTAVQGINPGDVVASSSFEKLQNNSKIIVSKKPIPASTNEGPAQ